MNEREKRRRDSKALSSFWIDVVGAQEVVMVKGKTEHSPWNADFSAH